MSTPESTMATITSVALRLPTTSLVFSRDIPGKVSKTGSEQNHRFFTASLKVLRSVIEDTLIGASSLKILVEEQPTQRADDVKTKKYRQKVFFILFKIFIESKGLI